MAFIQQLVQSIDGRISELNSELGSLREARSALLANGSAPTATRNREVKRTARQQPKPIRARRKPTRKRSVPLAETAERLLTESNGLTTVVLATKADAPRDQVLALLGDLEKANRVRRTGQRRSTRWHAITDEDGIRERAAQLAGRRRRRGKPS